MMNYIPPFSALAVSLQTAVDTPQARKFGITTRTLAANLMRATKEALENGNESAFNNAYIAYADKAPSSITANGGGQRFDVLTRMITTLSIVSEPLTVSQTVLADLANRLPSSSDGPPRNIITLHAADVTIRLPDDNSTNGIKYSLSGVNPLHIDIENSRDYITTMSLMYTRPTAISVTSYRPFVFSAAGGADQAPTNGVYLIMNAAGQYNFKVNGASRNTFTITGETAVSAFALTDLTLAKAGYDRVKRDGVLRTPPQFNTLDEWLVGVIKRYTGNGNAAALMMLYLEAYELTSRALGLTASLSFIV